VEAAINQFDTLWIGSHCQNADEKIFAETGLNNASVPFLSPPKETEQIYNF